MTTNLSTKNDKDTKPPAGDTPPPAGDTLKIPDGYTLIEKDEMAKIRDRLDFLERRGPSLVDTPPPAPSGPSIDEQVKGLNLKIRAIDKEIDARIEDGKGYGDLAAQRDELLEEKMNVRSRADRDAFAAQGLGLLEQMTGQVLEDKMPYLNVVRKDYDQLIAGLPPEGRASTTTRMEIYKLAVGRNMEKILEIEREKMLRAAADKDEPPPPPASRARADHDEGDRLPTFEEYFGADAMAAIRAGGKTPDGYARSLGYANAEEYVRFAMEMEQEEG